MRGIGVQSLASCRGIGWLDPAWKAMGFSHGIRALRAQPTTSRRTILPSPRLQRYDVLRLPRVPQQHAQYRHVRHHLVAQQLRVRAILHEQTVDRCERTALCDRGAGSAVRCRERSCVEQGQWWPGNGGRKELRRRTRAAPGTRRHPGRDNRQGCGTAPGGREPQRHRGPADAHSVRAQAANTPGARWCTNRCSAFCSRSSTACGYGNRQAGGLDRASRCVAPHSGRQARNSAAKRRNSRACDGTGAIGFAHARSRANAHRAHKAGDTTSAAA